MSEPSTPLMRQYAAVKKEHPNALLFFRLGDFYELFFEDAIVAAKELQITLTSRNKEKGHAIPMCGVPYHAAEGYIAKLIRKGFKVAICEQMEDPRMTKTLVKREVTRVVTPGTAADSQLGAEENNFLACVAQQGEVLGLAVLDLSTGEFRATEFRGSDAARRVREELLVLAAAGGAVRFFPALFDQPRQQSVIDRSRARCRAWPAWRMRRGRRLRWRTGCSRPITLSHWWRTTSACCRWRDLGWRDVRRRPARRARSCTTCARRSAGR